MRASDVEERLQRIRKVVWDDELAHSLEDELYLEVLRAIASGMCDDPKACAAKAIETQVFAFGRWCA